MLEHDLTVLIHCIWFQTSQADSFSFGAGLESIVCHDKRKCDLSGKGANDGNFCSHVFITAVTGKG